MTGGRPKIPCSRCGHKVHDMPCDVRYVDTRAACGCEASPNITDQGTPFERRYGESGKGVDVRLMVPRKTVHALKGRARHILLSYLPEMERAVALALDEVSIEPSAYRLRISIEPDVKP